jgi:hypothetical protein
MLQVGATEIETKEEEESIRKISFPSGFLIKILYSFLISPLHATCPADLIILDIIILITFT